MVRADNGQKREDLVHYLAWSRVTHGLRGSDGVIYFVEPLQISTFNNQKRPMAMMQCADYSELPVPLFF